MVATQQIVRELRSARLSKRPWPEIEEILNDAENALRRLTRAARVALEAGGMSRQEAFNAVLDIRHGNKRAAAARAGELVLLYPEICAALGETGSSFTEWLISRSERLINELDGHRRLEDIPRLELGIDRADWLIQELMAQSSGKFRVEVHDDLRAVLARLARARAYAGEKLAIWDKARVDFRGERGRSTLVYQSETPGAVRVGQRRGSLGWLAHRQLGRRS